MKQAPSAKLKAMAGAGLRVGPIPFDFPSTWRYNRAIVDGHAHVSVMFALDVIAIVFIAHFLARAWSGLYPNNPAMRGLSFVA